MRGGIRLGRAFPVLLAWAVGCEALVSGQLGDVDCQAEGSYGPPACPDGYACQGGVCVRSTLGLTCGADGDCSLGEICLDPGVWSPAASGSAPDAGMGLDAGSGAILDGGIVPWPPGQKRCSRTCCTSDDCGANRQFVCTLAPASGGSFCRAGAELGRAPGGAGEPMTVCTTDAECRSGLCLVERCADTCCSDTSCASGAQGVGACRFGRPVMGEPAGFWCSPPVADGGLSYALCSADTDCVTGLCGPLGISTQGRCLPPCCASRDCDPMGEQEVQCVTVSPGVRVCGAVGGTVGASTEGVATGVACTADSDCRSGICADHRGHKVCSDTCCMDTSCGDDASLVCRPVNIAVGWALRCEPR
jgi:hypothetical protein